jgi:hypothetical protein
VSVPALPPNAFGTDDAPTGSTPQHYRDRRGKRAVTIDTHVLDRQEARSKLPSLIRFESAVRDPQNTTTRRWRISEAMLRAEDNRVLFRQPWPALTPQFLNTSGLPLPLEVQNQTWTLAPLAATAPLITARTDQTLEMHWRPVVEREVTLRFGPFNLKKVPRARRLSQRATLTNGVLALRAWQLPPVGASPRPKNELFPLALWFVYETKDHAASFAPLEVTWEADDGRWPDYYDAPKPVLEGWNLAARRPRRAGEAAPTAWRSQNAALGADEHSIFLTIRGIERRVDGPLLVSHSMLSLPSR